MKLDKPTFGILIILLNAILVYVTTLLNLYFDNAPFVAPTVIFLEVIGNGAIVYLRDEQSLSPSASATP